MKKVRDPIHDYIHLEPAAVALVDTVPVQRLRHVRQLGTARLVYPGANHTRFEHSLGAYHVAGVASASLGLEDPAGLEVRAAALLHDVGHGPFSHLSEDLLREHLGRDHVEASATLVQEDPLAGVLEAHGADPKRVAALLGGEGALGELVAGELDVDRMDYLVRDGHYTGVDTGVDLERIVEAMEARGNHLVLLEEGVQAAEALLTARFLMYGTVYLHHAARVSEAMLERALEMELAEGALDAGELARMDDVDVTAHLRSATTGARGFMEAVDARELLKVAREVPFREVGEAEARRLAGDRAARRTLEVEVAEAAGVDPSHVILDAPPAPRLREGSVPVVDDGGDVAPLAERSQLVSILSEAYLDHWRLRIICPEEAREAVAAASRGLVPPNLTRWTGEA